MPRSDKKITAVVGAVRGKKMLALALTPAISDVDAYHRSHPEAASVEKKHTTPTLQLVLLELQAVHDATLMADQQQHLKFAATALKAAPAGALDPAAVDREQLMLALRALVSVLLVPTLHPLHERCRYALDELCRAIGGSAAATSGVGGGVGGGGGGEGGSALAPESSPAATFCAESVEDLQEAFLSSLSSAPTTHHLACVDEVLNLRGGPDGGGGGGMPSMRRQLTHSAGARGRVWAAGLAVLSEQVRW
jgi:hypothetical protein